MAYDNDYGCVIDPKFVSSFIKDFINASDWKIKRVYNNKTHYSDRAIILLNDKEWWCRVEIYSTKSFSVFYYCTNDLGYVVFDWAESHETTKELVDSLVVMGKNNS